MKSPVFIVGMPRSGTKLLRDILSQHKTICFPYIETECLPSWHRKYEAYDFDNFESFSKFYGDVTKGVYFRHQLLAGVSIIDCLEWFESVKGRNTGVAGVFEALIKHDVSYKDGMVWGDKSPSYIDSICTLKLIYPGSKIILIVRDVRDYCLSIRHAWNKNIYRAAQRWDDSNNSALDALARDNGSYSVVRYEDLLNEPAVVINKLCKFLEVDFLESMLTLRRPSETIGSAKGSLTIVSSNTGKWKREMKQKELISIEAITCETLYKLGYDLTSLQSKKKTLTRFRMIVYKIMDAYNLLFSNLSSEQSFFWKIKFYFRHALDRRP